MDPAKFDKLKERHRQCLRLVFENYGAKEIGRKLGISHHTVNEYLREAREALGVRRSIDAARLLITYEQYKRVVPKPVGVESGTSVDEAGPATEPALSANVARNRWHLERLHRIGLIVAIAFLAVAFAGALRAGLEDLTRFFWDYQIDISDQPYRQ
jgi:DNA-binding CsgD family transcriptional regulator